MTARRAAVILTMCFAAAGNACAVGLTKFVEKDTISLMAEGVSAKDRFALVFSRQAGSISVWHDLAADPKMEVNLSARGEGNGFALFQDRAEMVVDGKEFAIFPGPADEFVLTEWSPVRAILSLKGPYTTPTGEFPGEDLAKAAVSIAGREIKAPQRPRYETQFTVYPTGRVFIRHVLEVKGRPLELRSNRFVLATAPAEGVEAFNNQAMRDMVYLMPSSWIVHAGPPAEGPAKEGTTPAFPANALFVVALHQYPTDWLGQMMTFDGKRSGWTRSAFRTHGAHLVQPGRYVWNFMLQVSPSNLRSRPAAEIHALDYLRPGRLIFEEGRGSADLGDQQDEQLDGYVEGRGAYLLSADGKDVVEFRLDGGMQSRWCPTFEIRAWRRAAPACITVDGERRVAGTHFIAHAERSTLLVHYLGLFSPGEHTLRIEAERE